MKWIKNQRKIGTHLKIGEIGSNKKKEILEGVQKLERNVTDSKIESNWDRLNIGRIWEEFKLWKKVVRDELKILRVCIYSKSKLDLNGFKNWRRLERIQKSKINRV